MYYVGWAMLIFFGAMVALAVLPWLSLLLVALGLGPLCPAIVTELAHASWLIAASVAGVACFAVGKALNRLLNPIDGTGGDEHLDAALLAKFVIDSARRASRST